MPARFLIASIGCLLLTGCQTARFYSQAISGQMEILSNRTPVDQLLEAPTTDERLSQQLQLVRTFCDFAVTNLHLEVNGQYSQYTDLERRFVVWNVHAAPEFSMKAKSWWYPVAGRQEYQGYFRRQMAMDYARRLTEKGMDVYVGGVDAYSTLGWFKDPVLNTFIFLPELELADLIFHELAHQKLYFSGDTDFNEAFATAVAREGVRRWLMLQGDRHRLERFENSLDQSREVVQLILGAQRKLEALYATRSQNAEVMRDRKQRIIERLKENYAQWRVEHPGFTAFDGWFDGPVNNAQFNTVETYYDLVPEFENALGAFAGSLPLFYEAMAELKRLPNEERLVRLSQLGQEPALANRPAGLPGR